MKQRQLKVGLPEEVRAKLEAAASEAGHSIAEEIRQRLERSLQEDTMRVDVLRLEAEIGALVGLVEMQTGHRWNEHPATARVLQLAIDARLARYGARADARFTAGELPDVRLVAAGSDDPEVMAASLEAVVHNKTDISERFHALERHRQKQEERRRREAEIAACRGRLAMVEEVLRLNPGRRESEMEKRELTALLNSLLKRQEEGDGE